MANVKCNFLKYISLSKIISYTLVFPLFDCCISVRTDNLDKSLHTALQHVVKKYSFILARDQLQLNLSNIEL